jgi:hypothetical protein
MQIILDELEDYEARSTVIQNKLEQAEQSLKAMGAPPIAK